jgi:hypothetical protein
MVGCRWFVCPGDLLPGISHLFYFTGVLGLNFVQNSRAKICPKVRTIICPKIRAKIWSESKDKNLSENKDFVEK